MSIASQCSDCCTCPTATVEWDSRSASLNKCGFTQYIATTPPKKYLSRTVSGYYKQYFCCTSTPPSFRILAEDSTVTGTANLDSTNACAICDSDEQIETYTYNCAGAETSHTTTTDPSFRCDLDFISGVFNSVSSTSETTLYGSTSVVFTDGDCIDQIRIDSSETWTLSDEYTTADLKINTVAALPAYDNDWNDTAGSYANLTTDELSYSIRQSHYRLRFKIPKIGTGKSLRALWVERFIAEAGVGVSSVEVYKRGVYRPTVTISTSPLGINAAATTVMASDGTVASLLLLNPGSGYIPLITFSSGGGTGAAAIAIINSSGAVTSVTITSGGSGYTSAPTVAFTNVTAPRVRATGTAVVTDGVVTGINIGTAGDFRPTVTVQTATGGGTTSTGWIATLATTGEVATITGGNAGNYLPTLAFTGGGGSGATATCTVDSTGGIAAVTVTAGGSAYASEPTLTITSKVSGTTAADLIVHLGTETAKCAVWDGTTLGGKWVKREVVDAGHALTSIEVVHGGTGFTSPPTVAITGGGGSGATATATVSGGVITGITLGAAGSGYKTNPTITLSGGGGAGGGTVLLAAHFGTETEYADGAQPFGTLPLGYVDGVVRTYPIVGNTGTAPWKYYEIAVPSSNGTTLVNNVRTVCDGTACP